MKNLKFSPLFVLVAALGLAVTSCQKSAEITTSTQEQGILSGAVAIVPNSTILANSTPDSIYAVGACSNKQTRTAVDSTALPSAIPFYLFTNYEGYSFIKAFSTTSVSTGTLDGYVVAITYNGKPVVVKFDATGTFVKVLELREGKDLGRKGGHHDGGCYENRDGKHKDSLAISALPAAITAYFANNYLQDTIKNAWTVKNGKIIVISKNVSYFGTSFTAAGVFVKRSTLPSHSGKGTSIDAANLPALVTTYLTSTYPNYVFDKAYAHSDKSAVLKGYLVIIDANLTKYAVLFDASGNFVKVKTII
jgi:hypothetical protein